MAKFPSRLRRILASEGRFGFKLLGPLSLLLPVDELLSDWTPEMNKLKKKHRNDKTCKI